MLALAPMPTPVPPLPTVTLVGVELHALSSAATIAHVFDELAQGRGGSIVTPNLDHLRRLQQPGPFRDACRQASLRVCDGTPLLWAARLQGTPLPERVAGSDLTVQLAEVAAARGLSIFFLGGDPGTAEACAKELQRRFPGLRSAGTCCPPFGFDKDPAQLRAIADQLRAAAPDLVYVALGSPKQELLIAALQANLPRSWWIGVGISFSFVAGVVRRAPRLLQRLGLEWLHRLCQEPRRLARRYLVDGIPFAVRLFGSALRQRWRRRPAAPR